MQYTNGTFTGTHRQIQEHLGASLPRDKPENWPGGPWERAAYPQPEPSPGPSAEQVAEQQRNEALQQLAYDCGDGRLIQCRPHDEQNIRNAIEIMQRHGRAEQVWRLADNSHQVVTLGELQAALAYGQDQAATIWGVFFQETA